LYFSFPWLMFSERVGSYVCKRVVNIVIIHSSWDEGRSRGVFRALPL